MFQFTRPQGARRHRQVLKCRHTCFNSRARKGRDFHSRTRRRTTPLFQFTRPQGARLRVGRGRRKRDRVSIHAPARGATHQVRELVVEGFSFNSRARKGRDSQCWSQVPGKDVVSIHAPARGATRMTVGFPTPLWFQFTRPQGARLGGPGVQRTSREVSIHAPARGAT